MIDQLGQAKQSTTVYVTVSPSADSPLRSTPQKTPPHGPTPLTQIVELERNGAPGGNSTVG